MNTRTMPTLEEVIKNGATAGDFGIPDSEIKLAFKVAQAVQDDIADANDARFAHIIAEGLIETAEGAGYFMPDDVREEVKEAFVQAIAQDALSIAEASTKLDEAMIRYFETRGEEYE